MLTPNNIITVVCENALPIDHNHEDIDGTYHRLSAQWKKQVIFSFTHIMDTYKTIQSESSFTQNLIEVYNFNSFVRKHLLDVS